jgi:hypothetical protein
MMDRRHHHVWAVVIAVVTLAGVLIGMPAATFAWHRARPGIFVDIGPLWWPTPYPYWPYYPAPYYVYPPPPVVQEPPVYIQREPIPPTAEGQYWYYCPSARDYYPKAPTCPEAWIKVPPRPE